MIVKKKDKYVVMSTDKKKELGTYNTKHEAETRLAQIEMFKHIDAQNNK